MMTCSWGLPGMMPYHALHLWPFENSEQVLMRAVSVSP